MRLDTTRIAVRERSMLDILDLALHVIRACGGPLISALLVGIVGFALFNHWLIYDPGVFLETAQWRFVFVLQMPFLVILSAPIATAPATIYLGQTMFYEQPNLRWIVRDFWKSMPQIVLFHGLPYGLLVWAIWVGHPAFIALAYMAILTVLFLKFVLRPYLNEIVLLERNPLRRRRGHSMSTLRRGSALHSGSGGDLLARWLACAAMAALMTVVLILAFWGVKQWTTGNAGVTNLTFTLYVEIALWVVASYFTVVRFLNYLDLRIRREGWEVELHLRAEAARLTKKLA